MTPKQLKYFIHVVEFGSFTKAAVALSIPQPTLSRVIRHLEMELHQNLLIRDGRGVHLTEEGGVLLAHARGILQQIEQAHQDIINIKAVPIGKVVFGATPTAGLTFLTQLVSTFKNRFPKASLEILGGKSWNIYDWLMTGRIDIGILYDPRPSALLEITPVGEEEIFLVSPAAKTKLKKGTKIPVSDLGKYPMILPSQPHTMRTAVEIAAAKTGTKLNVTLEVEGNQFIMALVNEGHGCTLLPKHTVQESHLKGLQINSIIKPRLTRITAIAIPTQRHITYLTRETAKLITQYLKCPGTTSVDT
ncbi:MAG: LysR family transcriptional regulator [Betaproteobacteria bacterium]|nr:LysR family transcriptional regulator [Betaproteobacteria bacterium]